MENFSGINKIDFKKKKILSKLFECNFCSNIERKYNFSQQIEPNSYFLVL